MSAGSQSGKTVTEPLWLWREIEREGQGDYMAVTSSYKLFRSKFLPSFLRFFEQTGRCHLWAGDGIIEVAAPGRQPEAQHATDRMWGRVILGSAQSPSTLEAATVKAAVLDEAGQDEFALRAYQAIQRRLHIHQGRMLIGTTLYNSGWFVQQIVKPAKTDGAVEVIEERGGEIEVTRNERLSIDLIQFDSVVNPAFSSEEFERARATMAADDFAMFYRGRVGRPRTIIYDCYNEAVHKVPSFEPPREWVRVVGIDPLGAYVAAVFLAWDPVRKQLHAYQEYYEPFGLTTRKHASNIRDQLGPVVVAAIVCGQPAERQARVDFQSAGLPVIAPPFADVWVGIGRVYGMLKRMELVIHARCEHLLDELGRYQRKKDANGEPTDRIERKDDYHMCLAPDTLVTTARGQVPIEHVRVGDLTLTQKGWRRVLSSAQTGENELLWQATFSDGRTLTGTADHPLIMPDGQRIPLHALRYDDIIISEESCREKLSQSTGSRSIATQNPIAETTESTLRAAWTGMWNICTAICGRANTALSQMVATFTTQTAILSITLSIIWHALKGLLIEQSIVENGMPHTRKSRQIIGSALSTLRPLGIVALKAARGIAVMASALGRTASLSVTSASSAAWRSDLSNAAAFASAPMPASPHGGETQGLTTWSASVSNAARRSESTSIPRRESAPVRVVSVRSLGVSSRVYNLTIEDEHEFFANGILVANCDCLRYAGAWLTEPTEERGELVYQPAVISRHY